MAMVYAGLSRPEANDQWPRLADSGRTASGRLTAKANSPLLTRETAAKRRLRVERGDCAVTVQTSIWAVNRPSAPEHAALKDRGRFPVFANIARVGTQLAVTGSLDRGFEPPKTS